MWAAARSSSSRPGVVIPEGRDLSILEADKPVIGDRHTIITYECRIGIEIEARASLRWQLVRGARSSRGGVDATGRRD
jgi:hypothetical protein